MYYQCCGKALVFRSWWCACDECGRRYTKASNGRLVQISRPTPRAVDGGQAGENNGQVALPTATNANTVGLLPCKIAT